MSKKHLPDDLIVGDIVKLNNSDIVWMVHSISYSSIAFVNTNKNDNRISTMINTIDYYRTEPIQRWQEQLENLGYEYLTNNSK